MNEPLLGFSDGLTPNHKIKSILPSQSVLPIMKKFLNNDNIAIFEALAIYAAIYYFPYKSKNLAIYTDSTVCEFAWKRLDSNNLEV